MNHLNIQAFLVIGSVIPTDTAKNSVRKTTVQVCISLFLRA